MAFSLPADLPTNWVDNVGMIENAAFLNNVGTMGNSLKTVVNSTVTGAATAYVPTGESTTSTSYVDLATTTDQVTVTISSSGMALVILYANISCSSYGALMGYTISGATTRAVDDSRALNFETGSGTMYQSFGATFLETGLAAGSTTFKCKFRTTNAGTGTFTYRRIAVIPFF